MHVVGFNCNGQKTIDQVQLGLEGERSCRGGQNERRGWNYKPTERSVR